MDKPKYKNGCDHYLSGFVGTFKLQGCEFVLYFHLDSAHMSAFCCRHSDEDGDYTSGPILTLTEQLHCSDSFSKKVIVDSFNLHRFILSEYFKHNEKMREEIEKC